MSTERLMMPIYGLSRGCGGALSIEHALARVPGVSRAFVNPATEVAYIECDDEATNRIDLVTAVNRAGFRAGEPMVR
ncbi:MAG: heavy-metal-associated domain-containing protein [Dehalococcoidia bacterium]